MCSSKNILLSLLICFASCSKSQKEDNGLDLLREKKIVERIEIDLLGLNRQIVYLKEHFEYLLINQDSLLQNADTEKYKFADGYSTNTPADSSDLSSLVIFDSTPDYQKTLEQVYLTNGMDSVFKEVYSQNQLIAQVYFNSAAQLSRVYPAYDAKALLDNELDLTGFNFFYEGDLTHNPEKGPRWISEVYLDPAGKGWTLSLVQPVYFQDELYTVIGIDVTVDKLINTYLEKKDGSLLLVNNKGDIVGGKASSIEALSFPPLLNHVYRETIQSDRFRLSDFNLYNSKNKEVRDMGRAFIQEGKNEFYFKDEFSPEKAFALHLKLLDWYLVEIIERPV